MSPPAPTVYVVDDELGMVKALTRLLTAEGFTVRGFTSAQEFLEAYQDGELGCLVLDVAMPELTGFELQQRLLQAGSLLPIVFLTGRGDIPMSVQAMKAGAVDFLTKPVHDADLLRAVRQALERAAQRQTRDATLASLRKRYARLTPREREVMHHVVSGQLNKQIAGDLGTGEQNIKVHRGRMMRKMEVVSVADLVRAAEQLGVGKAGVGEGDQ
jgi:FixJ family two-component response regulator